MFSFDGELLEQIVEKITSNEDVWIAVMMAEEHNLSNVCSKLLIFTSQV
jgi:hypothetical protein